MTPEELKRLERLERRLRQLRKYVDRMEDFDGVKRAVIGTDNYYGKDCWTDTDDEDSD
jgi:hypothetical protein